MAREISVNLNIKERLKGYSLTQASISFKKEWREILDLNSSDEVEVIYDEEKNPALITIRKYSGGECKNIDSNGKILEKKELIKNTRNNNIYWRLSFPSELLKYFEKYGLGRKNFKCYVEEDRGEVRLFMPLNMERKKNVVLFKVNKGGIGKTFLTCQIGHGLAILGKKVLIVTSDSQNNVLNFLYPEKDTLLKYKKGLIDEVLYRKGEYINLRKNLDFIPLEKNTFGKVFIERLRQWFDEKREEYDYILIDSVPTMKIDNEFVNIADKIIIPAYCDEATVEGILNLLEDVDETKVEVIQINKFKRRVIEMKYKELLEKSITNLFGNTTIKKHLKFKKVC